MVISVEGSFEALKATPAAASTQSMVVSVEGSLVPGSYAAMTATAQLPSADSAPKLEMTTVPVATVTAAAGMKTTRQHRFGEYLIVGDPRLQKMDESDCLYLLREVPKCHFRARSYTSKESNRSSKLTIWGTRYVRDKKKNLPTKKASLSMTGKKVTHSSKVLVMWMLSIAVLKLATDSRFAQLAMRHTLNQRCRPTLNASTAEDTGNPLRLPRALPLLKFQKRSKGAACGAECRD